MLKQDNYNMNFCRRCGVPFVSESNFAFICQNGHEIFMTASPSIGVILFNSKNEILIVERAHEPKKGMFDLPGGFCDGPESLEQAVRRELKEEVALDFGVDYTNLQFINSGIEYYHYKGEDLRVLSCVFRATLTSDTLPEAFDDAVNPRFIPLADVDLDKMSFTVLRDAVEKLQAN